MADNIPLLDAPKPEQPQFPQMQYNVTPQGVVVTKIYDPMESRSFLIPAGMMNDMARDWRESRRNLVDFQQAVKQSRND